METETELSLYFETMHLFNAGDSETGEIKKFIKNIFLLVEIYRKEAKRLKWLKI